MSLQQHYLILSEPKVYFDAITTTVKNVTKPSMVLNLFRERIFTSSKLLLKAVKDINVTETPFGWIQETQNLPKDTVLCTS